MNRIDTARSVLRAAQQRLQQAPDSIEEARVGMSPEVRTAVGRELRGLRDELESTAAIVDPQQGARP